MNIDSSITVAMTIRACRSMSIQFNINNSIMISTNFQTCVHLNTNLRGNNLRIWVSFALSLV